MSTKKSKSVLQGFSAINIKFSKECSSHHQLFVKEHSVKNQTTDKPVGRTLFVLNVPPWATVISLKNVFSHVGVVESIILSNLSEDDTFNGNGFKCAYVIFKRSEDLCKAVKLTELPEFSTLETPILTGVDKWIKNYNDQVKKQLQHQLEAEEIIKEYDKEEVVRLAKEKAGIVDEEGWTLVMRKGTSRKESVVNNILKKKSKTEKALKNFYRHQIRESQRDQLAELRKKAEEDKKKILALKQRKAFKPF